MNNLHEKLKNLRINSLMTQQEVADKMFVTRQCVSRWEQGKSIPDIYILENLSKLFNISLNELLDDKTTKSLIVENASNLKKRDKLIYLGILIGIVAIIISFSIILFIGKDRETEIDFTFSSYKGQIVSIIDQIVEVESFDEIYVLDFQDHRFPLVINNRGETIEFEDLKNGDIIRVFYEGAMPSKNIASIEVIDSVITRSLYGVFLDISGNNYSDVSQLPTSSEPETSYHYDGFRYFYCKHNQSQWNLGHTQTEHRFIYDNNFPNYSENIISLTFYIDLYKVQVPLKLGMVTSDGIIYSDELNLNQEYTFKGEFEYPTDIPYFKHSVDVTYKVVILHRNTISSIEVFQYDKNNLLIKESKLINFLDIYSFSAETDALYCLVKINYYEDSKFSHSNIVEKLYLGNRISLDFADTYGMKKETDFKFKVEYANIIYK